MIRNFFSKRSISAILAFAMIFGVVPTNVFATSEPTFKADTSYEVEIYISDNSYTIMGSSYNEIATIKTDSSNNAKISIETLYSTSNWATIINDMSIYTTKDGSEVVSDMNFETISTTTDGAVCGIASFTLPYVNADGIYKGITSGTDSGSAFDNNETTITADWSTLTQVFDKTTVAPVFSEVSGTVFDGVGYIELTSSTPDAKIYYETDEYWASTPTTSSTLYTAPIEITKETYIKAFAVADGYNDSLVVEADYDSKPSPKFEASSVYEVELALKSDGYSPYISNGEYNSTAIIKTDSLNNAKISIDSLYSTSNYDTVINDISIFSTKDGSTVVSDMNFETISTTTDGAVCGVASFTLPYVDGDYYGLFSAYYNGTQYNDVGLTVTVDWTTLNRTGDNTEVPPSTSKVATPTYDKTLNPDDLFVGETNTVLGCATDGARIFYTTDGTTPTTSSNEFYYTDSSANISVSQTTTIKAFATKAGFDDSDVLEFTLTKTTRTADVTFNPTETNFEDTIIITLSSQTPNAVIRYALNHSNDFITYTKPFEISQTTHIEAYAQADGLAESLGEYKTYTKSSSITFKPNATYTANAYLTQRGYTGSYLYGDDYLDLMDYNGVIITTDGNAVPKIQFYGVNDGYTKPYEYITHFTLENMDYFNFEVDAHAGDKDFAYEKVSTLTFTPKSFDVSGKYHGTATTTVKPVADIEIYVDWSTLEQDTEQTKAPTFSPADGHDFGDKAGYVTLTSETPNAEIYYTTHEFWGDDPAEAGALYEEPILITEKTVIRAMAIADGHSASDNVSASFTASPLLFTLEPNTNYEVDVFLKDANSSDYDSTFNNNYTSPVSIKTDADNNAKVTFDLTYNWNYDSYITAMSIFDANTGTNEVSDFTFTEKGTGTEHLDVRAEVSFTLPYMSGDGIYYGTATQSELDWGETNPTLTNYDIEFVIDWSSLVYQDGEGVEPNPPEGEETLYTITAIYDGTLSAVDTSDAFFSQTLYGPESSIHKATDGKMTMKTTILQGFDMNTFQAIYYKDMKIYLNDTKSVEVSDLEYNMPTSFYDFDGYVSFTLEDDTKDKYYIVATMQDNTTREGFVTLNWDTLREILPQVEMPVISPAGGMIEPETTITITTATEGADIYYILDETGLDFPYTYDDAYNVYLNENAIKYEGPFTIDGATYVNAQASKEGMFFSAGVSSSFEVNGVAKDLSDFTDIEYLENDDYNLIRLITDESIYADIMISETGMPTVSEYYILVEQNGVAEKHVWYGGIGGFFAKSNYMGNYVNILLEKGKWDTNTPINVTVFANDYYIKELVLDLSSQTITSQTDRYSNDNSDYTNRQNIENGKTYTAKFRTIKTGTSEESMLGGFFDATAKISVGTDGPTNITFKNTVMNDQLLDFGLKGLGNWTGALADGNVSVNGTQTLFTIPVSTEDFKNGDFSGAVNVLAMGGSVANNGNYETYTLVEIYFDDEILEGFEGFESEQTGLTQAKKVNRLLVGDFDANYDGYVSKDEIKSYNGQNINLTPGAIYGYSPLDDLSITDISWLELLNKENITYIDLTGHHINTIEDEFKGFVNLEVLELRANSIVSIKDGAFKDLGKLHTLGLSSNSLTTITAKTFEGLTSIGAGEWSDGEFSLDSNNINKIEQGAFENFASVTHLFLYHNQLTELEAGTLSGLDSLVWFDAFGNQLTEIPKDLKNIATLEYIDLSSNRITTVGDVFDGLENLDRVDLSNNFIGEIPEYFAEIFAESTVVNLSNNALTTLPANYIRLALAKAMFKNVFENNPIDVSKLTDLTEDELNQVKEILGLSGINSSQVNLNLTAKDKEISFTQEISAFDLYFWNYAISTASAKTAIRQALGKDTIDNIEEYKIFRQHNLPTFSTEDYMNSILGSASSYVTDYEIETTLEKLVDDAWVVISTDIQSGGEDLKSNSFEDLEMAQNDEYRLLKKIGNYNIIAYATAVVTPDEPDSGGSGSTGGSSGDSSFDTSKDDEYTNKDGSTTTVVIDAQTGDAHKTTTYDSGVKVTQVTTVKGETTAKIEGVTSKAEVTISLDEKPNNSTVAVIVFEDGSTQIIANSVANEDGLLVTVLEDVTIKIIDNQKSFDDVLENNWFKDSVDFVTSREIFNGTQDDEFSPETTMTRSMIWTVLYRYNGETGVTTGENWYANAMNWAILNNISDGTNPNEDMTREQLVTILYRYSKEPEITTTLNTSENVSSWAEDAMNWAIAEGLVQGDTNGNLNPKNTATRAEVATILMRYISK